MYEREARYAAEFVDERIKSSFSGVGSIVIGWRPATEPGERECRVIIPVEGAATAGKIMARISQHFGQVNEIQLPAARGNIFICRRLGVPGALNMPKRLGAPWLISIWSTPSIALPDIEQRYLAADLTVELGENLSPDSDWRSGIEFEGEPAEANPDAVELQKLLRDVAGVVSAQRKAADLRVTPLLTQGSPEGPPSLMVVVHGLTSAFAGSSLLCRVLTDVPLMNTAGLVELRSVQLAAEHGWEGKYAAIFAQTVFGKLAVE